MTAAAPWMAKGWVCPASRAAPNSVFNSVNRATSTSIRSGQAAIQESLSEGPAGVPAPTSSLVYVPTSTGIYVSGRRCRTAGSLDRDEQLPSMMPPCLAPEGRIRHRSTLLATQPQQADSTLGGWQEQSADATVSVISGAMRNLGRHNEENIN